MYDTIKIRDNIVYFPIKKANLKMFEECKDNIEEYIHEQDGKIYLRFNWNLVTFFADKKQLVKYHEQRKIYIKKLIDKYCSRDKQCYSKYIGSDTPKSDIDINLNCPLVQEIVADIMCEHHRQYHDSLEDMFDTNIYGTMLRQFGKECAEIKSLQTACHPAYYALYSQRVWSFL